MYNIIETSSNVKEVAKAEAKLKKINDQLKNSIVAEDLGVVTSPAKAVMEKIGLNGIKVSRFMNPASNDDSYLPTSFNQGNKGYWYMAGSHDMSPMGIWSNDIVKNARIAKDAEKMRELKAIAAENEHSEAGIESQKILNDIEGATSQVEYAAKYLYGNSKDYESKKERMYNDPKFLMESEYALILKSPAENVQLFFTDLFGDSRATPLELFLI